MTRRLLFLGVLLLSATHAGASVENSVGVVPTFSTLEMDNGFGVDIASLPLTLGVRGERAALRVTFPYLQMEARLPVIYVGPPIFRFPIGGQVISEEGPGDVLVNPTFLFVQGDQDRPWFWGSLAMKAPTADPDRHLGTGEFDYAPGLGLMKIFGTRCMLSGTVRYQVRGDPPDLELENVLGAGVTLGLRAGELESFYVTVAHAESVVAGGEQVWTAGLAYYHPFRNHFGLFVGGMTDLSIDGTGYGAAFGLTYRDDPFRWGT